MQSEKVYINPSFTGRLGAKDTILLELLANFMMYSAPDGSPPPYVPIRMHLIPSSVVDGDGTQSSEEQKADSGRETDQRIPGSSALPDPCKDRRTRNSEASKYYQSMISQFSNLVLIVRVIRLSAYPF